MEAEIVIEFVAANESHGFARYVGKTAIESTVSVADVCTEGLIDDNGDIDFVCNCLLNRKANWIVPCRSVLCSSPCHFWINRPD